MVTVTLGGLVEDTISTISAISRAQAIGLVLLTPAPLFRRLAIALWIGNTCLWLHRFPTLPPSLNSIIEFSFFLFFVFCFVVCFWSS